MADDERSTCRQPERRASNRIPFDQEASLILVNQNASLPCRIVDLSGGGCRIRTESRFLAGPMIRVEVCFRFRGTSLRLPGLTQWTDRAHAAGVRFLHMTPRRIEALAEVLAAIEQSPSTVPPAPSLPAAKSNAVAQPSAPRSASKSLHNVVRMPIPKHLRQLIAETEEARAGAEPADENAAIQRSDEEVKEREIGS